MLGAETISRGVATLRRPAPLPTRLSDQYPHPTRTPLTCQLARTHGRSSRDLAMPRAHYAAPCPGIIDPFSRITAACPASTSARKCPGPEYHGPDAARGKALVAGFHRQWWERCRLTRRALNLGTTRVSDGRGDFAGLGNFKLCRVLAAHTVGTRSCPVLIRSRSHRP
jgi:hypothetical protein